MASGKWYTYVFVRLNLSPAQQIIQVGHAVHEAACRSPHLPAPHMVLFEVDDEAELIEIIRDLSNHKIGHATFFEPDYDIGYTAIATFPLQGDVRSHFAKYRLHSVPKKEAA